MQQQHMKASTISYIIPELDTREINVTYTQTPRAMIAVPLRAGEVPLLILNVLQ